MLQLHDILHRSVIALDFPLGLRVVGSATGVSHTALAQVICRH
jgi:hypothetical protein